MINIFARKAADRRKVETRVIASMEKAGFKLLGRDVLYEKPIGRVLYPEDELIFNRGLDGKKSNFCVFAKCEIDGTVVLHHYNPDRNGFELRRDEFIRKTILRPDATDGEIASAIAIVKIDATKKRQNEFFFAPHNHFGALAPPHFDENGNRIKAGAVKFDDGVSFLTDNIRKALFYGIDYYSLTTHNSFSNRVFEFMTWAGHLIGLTPIPGIELTLPMKEPNGPHILVWMKNARVARRIRRDILEKGTRLDMPAYFVGMSMDRILEILFEYQKHNLLALGIAHPINFNSPTLPVPIVGLYSAVDTGATINEEWATLEAVERIAKRFDSVAMWNTSLYGKAKEVRVGNDHLKNYLRHVNRVHVGNRRLWANQTNFALAQDLSKKYGLHTHFETDEHATLPFLDSRIGGYVIGGDSLGMGMTVIELPETRTNWKKPTPSELIDLIRSKAVEMYGYVFAVKRAEAMTIHAERGTIPEELKPVKRRYNIMKTLRYAGMLIKDLMVFAFEGHEERIENMPGD
ncbi:MAG: hypothetical protein ABID61_05120 [Candidatus Micrarchaeota archaeon]